MKEIEDKYPSKAEIDILFYRLQHWVSVNNQEKIQEIINEAKEMVKRIKKEDEQIGQEKS